MTAIKTLIWSIIVGGTAVIVVPWLLLTTIGKPFSVSLSELRYPGIVVICFGVIVYGWSAWAFTFIGKGTPAPFDPPRELVIRGPYRYVRNPIYVYVVTVLIGEAIFFENIVLIIYAALALIFLNLWIALYEEPGLRNRFGQSYMQYCKEVPRWVPRLPFGRVCF